jgi:hypothetical protein
MKIGRSVKMKMKIKRKPIVFIVILLGLLLSSCIFVRIQNVSDTSITVLVTVPDSGSGYTRNIRAGAIVDVFSAHGGPYTVTMLPSERYKASLKDLQAIISKRLFEERNTLTSEEVKRLTENLREIDKLIKELAQPMAACAGTVSDFETAVAVVVWDSFSADYSLSCSSN